ncbi:anhydro-N-acetylmuramyl-tripeptide amidase [Algimonas ampicilliniresistens]|uniref:N-acetylmuramoyl-L-alanine amidase n=2 Tax=Algimonas ampicilliniresistens TaxID=1298735 RepID=A0ABQ5VBU0_9PROT|nr:anhydro-N-acetylmuramyl-tripeptide amidase [Algimonas ampicilliniresistens]
MQPQRRRDYFKACKSAAQTALVCLALPLMAACSTTAGTTQTIPSENYNGRVSVLVIHHTSANFEDSVNILTKPSSNSVSSHYLVPDPSDTSYKKDTLEVYELVPESERAWHAGRSYWNGKSALNDDSIGIEVVNQTYCVKADAPSAESSSALNVRSAKRFCFYPDFPESQIEILVPLIDGILKRHPRITPTQIVGHSDIAPDRKIDPGPRFPWHRLYKLGYGAWFDDDVAIKYWNRFLADPVPITNVQMALSAYGYKIEKTGVLDTQTRNVIQAFQLHFRPSEITGEPSTETVAILYALIEKYRANELDDLLSYEQAP